MTARRIFRKKSEKDHDQLRLSSVSHLLRELVPVKSSMDFLARTSCYRHIQASPVSKSYRFLHMLSFAYTFLAFDAAPFMTYILAITVAFSLSWYILHILLHSLMQDFLQPLLRCLPPSLVVFKSYPLSCTLLVLFE